MARYLKEGRDPDAAAAADAKVRAVVETALADIAARGDAAVREMSARFDGWDRESYRLTEAEIARCMDELAPEDLDDIRFAQAQGDYARLHTASGSHLVRIPLNTLEERWECAGFVRIHRSTLVSTNHITEVRLEHGRFVVVIEGAELQVSRRHTRDLRERLLRPRSAER